MSEGKQWRVVTYRKDEQGVFVERTSDSYSLPSSLRHARGELERGAVAVLVTAEPWEYPRLIVDECDRSQRER